MRRLSLRVFYYLLLGLVAGCTTSPTGRSQLLLMPESELAQLGTSAFEEIKRKTPVSSDDAANRYVRCVADSIIRILPGERPESWEVRVFEDKAINAFALPGRKIGVYRGLLKLSENQHQLATVLGHEVAHNRAHHANERVSTSFVTESSLQLIQVVTGSNTPMQRQLFGLLGLGTQVGVLLPFSRAQETEADLIGMDMMSAAGFDPRESVKLWQKMDSAAGSKPPEFLSTHPSGQHRIAELNARMNNYLQKSLQARQSGRNPDCR